MTDISTLCPKNEQTWTMYYNRNNELLFFLTSPAHLSSTLAAQTGAFTLYGVVPGARGSLKAKKLGQGGNPAELEAKYKVTEKLKS